MLYCPTPPTSLHRLDAEATRRPDGAVDGEDLQQQLGVLTEERDCARAREEELFASWP